MKGVRRRGGGGDVYFNPLFMELTKVACQRFARRDKERKKDDPGSAMMTILLCLRDMDERR